MEHIEHIKYTKNKDLYICILIICIATFFYLKQFRLKTHGCLEAFTNTGSDKFKKIQISNQKTKLMQDFFKDVGLTYCSYSIFDDKDKEEIDNNATKNKSPNKKYAKHLCYGPQSINHPLPKLHIKYISKEIGFGLFTDQNFKKHDYIGEFCGTITSNPDPSSEHYNYSYIDDSDIVIAPRKIGNELQFANHSVTANVKWKHIIGHDGYEHVIFIATRQIVKGEQILVDYGENYWTDSDRKLIVI
jgi:hypothetical protein